MSIQNVSMREVTAQDDFKAIYEIINETELRFLDPSKKGKVSLGESADDLKESYCNQDSHCKGFIAYNQVEKIVAFMGVTQSESTKNGFIQYGNMEGHEQLISPLLEKCAASIKEQGGTKIVKFVPAKFGQIRNEEITFFEKFGFMSDEFAYMTTNLALDSWERPAEFDSFGIEPVTELNRDRILQLLLEDGEEDMAELFKTQFSSNRHLDQVTLVLRDEQTNEIAGLAYYRVMLTRKGTEAKSMEATAFGVHFRPMFPLGMKEKSRLIQAALQSMKELGLTQVFTRLTLKNFDTFAAMVKEGFHNQDLEDLNIIRLTKTI